LLVLTLALSFIIIGGPRGLLDYYPDPGGAGEQVWLDKAIDHLRCLASQCRHDPELYDVLCYTIVRYDRVGRLDVSFQSLRWFNTHKNKDGWHRCIGHNHPLFPGFIVDHDIRYYPIHEGAGILVHEALHDYWPYFGHAHVTPIMRRYEQMDNN
jgi:hypothetical protein